MSHIHTEVLVIGGGATGTGIVRDLAMRGYQTILVEKNDLTYGTTGRYHGLLHSGGRYVVRDPQAAHECIEENRVLRKIMPECIEDTGGFFVSTPWDDPDYIPMFVSGCEKAGIPIEEISIQQMLREEPLLNPAISRCFRVPDASADSFLAAELNVRSAEAYGAKVLNYHQVTGLITAQSRVVGAKCHNLVNDEMLEIFADMVVNAAGAWAGRIAEMAGVLVQVIPGKGTMVAMNHRIVNTVINRCKRPSDGDILVPAHTVSIIGTTDVKVPDPDHFSIEPWEVQLCLEEGDKLIPGFKHMRMLRSWAGVRPLYQETNVSDTRDVTRAFVLLDHSERDHLDNFITITGGKWTTYRKMAEVTVDLVGKKLGSVRACRTHLEPLDGKYAQTSSGRKAHGHHLGERLADIEKHKSYGRLICECELVTEDQVTQAILHGSAKTIDDIRRDVRLGMGPCQGGFCTYRAAGLLHRLKSKSVQETNLAIRDFLQERWKGLLPILWGQQLRQEKLDELIYLGILNADHLPGSVSGRLSPELYAPAESDPEIAKPDQPAAQKFSFAPARATHPSKYDGIDDVLVIGAGLSGLAAAAQAARRGLKVRLISKGRGSLYWQTGCIDVLGYAPKNPDEIIESPIKGIGELIAEQPDHPYALAGVDTIAEALNDLQTICQFAGYPLHGDLEKNRLLPSALGIARPTCLAPEMMIAGDLENHDPILMVGMDGYIDFYPELIADNLNEQGIPARSLNITLPELQERRFINARTLAILFESDEFCESAARNIKKQIGQMTGFIPKRVGFPAVLGIEKAIQVKGKLEAYLGIPVFEVPSLPPSIPGIRLHQILSRQVENSGGRLFDGMQVVQSSSEKDQITALWSESAARLKKHQANTYILASGGILGGGLWADYDGSVTETVCGLPIAAPPNRKMWLNRQFLSSASHPIYQIGVRTNREFQPIGEDGNIIYQNLYAVGNILAGFDSIQERSHEGIALVSGYLIGKRV